MKFLSRYLNLLLVPMCLAFAVVHILNNEAGMAAYWAFFTGANLMIGIYTRFDKGNVK